MTPSTLFRLSSELLSATQAWRLPRFLFINCTFQTSTTTRRSARGFTLIELLVVIAIVAILISLIMVGVGRANQAGRATVCRGNLRTIGLAANTYSSSNKGRLPSPRTDTPMSWANLRTDPNETNATTREDAANTYIGWVRTEISVPGSIKADGFDQYETTIALQKGSLYDYIGSNNAYKSPQDPTARVRSYSLNSFVGVMYCDDFYRMPGNISASTYTFDTRTISRIQKPAETLLALPEWDQNKGKLGWNANGYLGNPEVAMNETSGAYTNAKWYDAPSVWNPGFINMARVDGSVDTYTIESPDLKNGELQKSWTSGSGYTDPDGDTYVDLFNIKKMLLPGKIK